MASYEVICRLDTRRLARKALTDCERSVLAHVPKGEGSREWKLQSSLLARDVFKRLEVLAMMSNSFVAYGCRIL